MYQIFAWLGGVFYLLNKIFFSFAERASWQQKKLVARQWRIASWAAYIIGLGPWVAIFADKHNWIAASVEASGAPAMLLGLVNAIRNDMAKRTPRWLDCVAGACILLGFGISLYDFGGLTNLSQWLEVGLVSGFLVGTYLLAKNRPSGYLWFVLMHLTCGWLMWLNGFPWLFAQQALSLVFIVDAYLVSRRRR